MTGINKKANISNTDELRTCLLSTFPSLVKETYEVPDSPTVSVASPTEVSCEVPKRDGANHDEDYSESDGQVLVRRGIEVKSSAKIDCKISKSERDDQDKKKCETKCSRPVRSSSKVKRSSFDDSSDEEDTELNLEGTKIKLDPDFTPKKYEEVKEDLQIQLSSVKRMAILNTRLRDNLSKCETENEELREKNASLETELNSLKKKQSSSKERLLKYEQEIEHLKQEIQHLKQEIQQLNSPKNKQISSSGTTSCSSAKPSTSDKKEVGKEGDSCDGTSAKPSTRVKMEVEEEGHLSDDSSKAYLCDTILEDGNDTSGVMDSEMDSQSQENIDQSINDFVLIKADVMAFIQKTPRGEKKDLKFIKDLALVSFGPDVLAKSTIMGTRKGGRKKKSDEAKSAEDKRPPLDKDILSAVRKELIRRVAREEGAQIQDPDEHGRTNKKRFHEAIRGAQKVWRDRGYGLGLKSNDFDKDMIM